MRAFFCSDPFILKDLLPPKKGEVMGQSVFRAKRIMGYQTDVVQFVSSEHTEKNLMIRAVKSLKFGDSKFARKYRDLKDFWNVTPYLEQLLGEDFTKLLPEVAGAQLP